MARKPYVEEEDNRERWLVSYADFITLLFAFFVVMYAVSSVNDGKVRNMSNALTTAFGRLPAATPPVHDRLAPELPVKSMTTLPFRSPTVCRACTASA